MMIGLMQNNASAQSNGLLREVFEGIQGQTLNDLRSAPKYPDSPDVEEFWTEGFDMPVDVEDFYGQRIRGYVVPEVTGQYTFWISGDDNCELYMSVDEDPEKANLIASVPGWTSHQQFEKYPAQKSAARTLSKGKRYYIEALMKEHVGGDSLTVRWQKPDGAIESPVPNAAFQPYIPAPPGITKQPEDLLVEEGKEATFEISISKPSLVTIQWYQDDSAIAGATKAQLVLPQVSLDDDGSRIRAELKLPDGETINSESATLSVQADTTAPEVDLVTNLGGFASLTINFSETVTKASAESLSNYSIDKGIQILNATLLENAKSVVLELTPMQPGVPYSITIENIKDQSNAGNALTSSVHPIGFDFEALERKRIVEKYENLGPTSRISGLVISEIMYHPPSREDGKSIEFIEIFNTEEWDLDLDGFRLSGEVNFTFPKNTSIGGRRFLVVARDPEAVKSVYGINRVLGPWAGALGDGGGRIRLRNAIDGLVQEIEYSDTDPWPTGADGTGHSLVLASPSYGENDPRAWRPSNVFGGSPAKPDTYIARDDFNLVINEIMTNSPDPQPDFVELYNYSNEKLDVSGYILTDNPGLAKYVIPDGTEIGARRFLTLDENELGFALNSDGETLYLIAATRDRVVDAYRFRGQPVETTIGRYPDGSNQWTQLSSPSPDFPNTGPRVGNVVINEIMYNPISRESRDEYVELHNRSGSAIDISTWRIRGDISYTFPSGTMLPAQGYVVIANDREHLTAKYAALSGSNTFGNFNGNLSNASGTIRLLKPELREVSVPDGGVIEQTIYVIEDELTYVEGGSWPDDADGNGSSLELVRADVDNNTGANWAASAEAHKAEWKEYSWTGRLDNGTQSADELQIMMLSSGECLVDDISVTQNNSGNLLRNPGFEQQFSSWVKVGNHIQSKVSQRGEASTGNYSLHVIASSGGDNGANKVESDLSSNLSINQNATISAKVKWIKGSQSILFRLHGNYGELSAEIEVPNELGTPGQENSRKAANTPPSITEVTHFPVLPGARKTVTVQARVTDADKLGKLELKYRKFPSRTYETVAMDYRGAGYYTAEIPGQSSGTKIGFFVQATDAHQQSMTTAFPGNSLEENGIIWFGSRNQSGTFGNYHIWIGDENLNEWRSRAKLSNELLPVTFVYGEERAIHGATGRYRGSPFIRPGYGTPDNSSAMGLIFRFPPEQLLLGSDKVNLDGLEPGRDDTSQREKTSFWIGEQLGISYSHQRYIRVFVNGTRKSDVYTDSMQPDSDYLDRWYPGNSDGDLYKIDDWFEFSDGSNPGRTFNRNARLTPFRTTGGALKTAAYRWMWEKKSNGGYNDDYSSLLSLVETMNASNQAYTSAVDQAVDVDQWMRTFATRHIVGDWDGYGYNRGKNQSAFKPDDGKWKMLLWDLDFSLGGGSNNETTSMYNVDDPTIARFYSHPPFQRAYLRAWQDAVDGPLSATAIREQTNKVLAGLRANGVITATPNALQGWVDRRRNYLVSQLRPFNTELEFVTNSGNNFNSDENIVELTGTAPVKIHTLLFNGIPLKVEWTSATRWSAQMPLFPGQNEIEITGIDYSGEKVGGEQDSIRINYTGEAVDPADFLTINEIHYNSGGNGLSFLEIFNRSSEHSFNLGGMRINGLNYQFAPGSAIDPSGFILLASDAAALSGQLDPGVTVFDEFNGNLDNDGETISLVAAADPGEEGEVIDQVRYDDIFPWPLSATGQGPSLQLISPELDNRRPGNWFASEGNGFKGSTNVVMNFDQVWKFNQSGNNLGTGWRASNYDDDDWESGKGLLYVENAGLPAPKGTPLTRGPITFYFRTNFEVEDPAQANLFYTTILDDGAVIYINGKEIARPGMPAGTISASTTASRTVGDASQEGPFNIPSSALRKGVNVIAVEAHQTNANSSDIVWGMAIEDRRPGSRPFTPGKPNSGAPEAPDLPPLWLNEFHLGLNPAPDSDSWVEIYHSGEGELMLAGYYLSDDAQNLRKWGFPSNASIGAGAFGNAGFNGQMLSGNGPSWPVSFAISAERPVLYLTYQSEDDSMVVVDYIDFGGVFPGRSLGSFPDGNPASRVAMVVPTPFESNTISSPEVQVFFSEWMSLNTVGYMDPIDKQFPDWFELYNAGSEAVDLSGYFLTDRPTGLRKFEIPAGVVLQPQSYMLFIADSEPEQNEPGGIVHTNFRLSSTNGESLILSNPAGVIIDRVDFAAQQADISEGRKTPEKASEIVALPRPTPGTANDGSGIPSDTPEIAISRAATPGAITISWQTASGTSYQLLWSDSITNPMDEWFEVELIEGNGQIVDVTVETSKSAEFFILKSLRQ